MSAISLSELVPFIAVGFAAQLVDGALGMAFGIISSTFLISLGVPPASASASVHAVESITTAASGTSHILHRNVDWRLLARLVVPGVAGAILGAFVLTRIHVSLARPLVTAYLLLMGIYLLWRGFAGSHKTRTPRVIEPLGAIGGFLDAAGGGGWGPVVTSNLLVQGGDPRKVIGTVNTAEFVITLSISGTFLIALGAQAFANAGIGLLAGGVIAAPLGAWATKRISAPTLLILVGVVLSATSCFGLINLLS
jgi:uncharacterized membrane protein YfcA